MSIIQVYFIMFYYIAKEKLVLVDMKYKSYIIIHHHGNVDELGTCKEGQVRKKISSHPVTFGIGPIEANPMY